MKTPSFGQIADLNITAQSLVSTYRSMLKNDKVDIFVLGDVDEQEVNRIFAKFAFTDRPLLTATPMYQQIPYPQVQKRTDYQKIVQAKLDLAYRFPVYYHDDNYYAALVFNGIFGGTPYSKLFVNVREKAGLAYYATSRFLPFNGLLSVQTGIQAQNSKQAQTLIAKQLQEIQVGDFSDIVMQEVKDSIINQYQAGHDLANNVLEQKLITAILNQPVPNFVEKIQQVTREDIIRVAKLVELQAVYLLSGEE